MNARIERGRQPQAIERGEIRGKLCEPRRGHTYPSGQTQQITQHSPDDVDVLDGSKGLDVVQVAIARQSLVFVHRNPVESNAPMGHLWDERRLRELAQLDPFSIPWDSHDDQVWPAVRLVADSGDDEQRSRSVAEGHEALGPTKRVSRPAPNERCLNGAGRVAVRLGDAEGRWEVDLRDEVFERRRVSNPKRQRQSIDLRSDTDGRTERRTIGFARRSVGLPNVVQVAPWLGGDGSKKHSENGWGSLWHAAEASTFSGTTRVDTEIPLRHGISSAISR